MQTPIDPSNTIVVMFDFNPIDNVDTRCEQVASWLKTNCPECVQVESRVWLIVKSPYSVDELFERIGDHFGAGDCVALFKVASMMLGVGDAGDLQRLARKN